MQGGQKRILRVLLGLGAAVVALGGHAFACTNLATLNLSTTSGKPGDNIVVTGSGFQGSMNDASMAEMGMDMSGESPMMGTTAGLAARSPVVLRWNGADGPILSNAIPDRSGTISVTITIPETQAGHYMLLAVQKNAQGFDVYGTPARAAVLVTGESGEPAQPVSSALAGASGESGIGPLVLTVTLGALGLGLFAAGGIAFARQRQRRSVPAAVRRD